MGSKGTKYPKSQIRRQKQKQIYSQKATPTENGTYPEQDDSVDGFQEYDAVKSTGVPAEKPTENQITDFLKKVSAILAAIAAIIAAIFWLARIEFKVDKAETDINEQKVTIKSMTSNIQNIKVFHAGVKKDLEYLKENKKK